MSASMRPSGSMLDVLLDDARRHLADLYLRRITATVRPWYPQAAALRFEPGEPGENVYLLAVLGADSEPLYAGSRDRKDEDTDAWSETAVESMDDMIVEDLAWYVSLTPGVNESHMPLAGA
ncbi:hypothetical protein FDG2_0439 [Candidatus Protofrankia californiensis]|uniref:Uncharacterized protein n=1 Tax=Candidatus Protofrankia californiensis TaxID=1839754 RepID=A0A1C3NTJ7_9ACTN|nr:hypothetical protein FDG2_0439 [Candidatus Protofrankia californiensis]